MSDNPEQVLAALAEEHNIHVSVEDSPDLPIPDEAREIEGTLKLATLYKPGSEATIEVGFAAAEDIPEEITVSAVMGGVALELAVFAQYEDWADMLAQTGPYQNAEEYRNAMRALDRARKHQAIMYGFLGNQGYFALLSIGAQMEAEQWQSKPGKH